MNTLSKNYGEWATRLSELIHEFEVMLNNLEGKTENSVSEGLFVLSFRRAAGRWGLFYQQMHAKPPQPLASAPVDAKIDAVRLFRPLLQQLAAHHRSKRDGLLSAIGTVEDLLGRKTEA